MKQVERTLKQKFVDACTSHPNGTKSLVGSVAKPYSPAPRGGSQLHRPTHHAAGVKVDNNGQGIETNRAGKIGWVE